MHVPLGTVPHIVNCFTTAVTVSGEFNLLRIYTLTTPVDSTITAFFGGGVSWVEADTEEATVVDTA